VLVADVGPSVVRHVVISRKLSKTDSQLLLNIIRKSASLIRLPHSSCPRRRSGTQRLPPVENTIIDLLNSHDRPDTPCLRDISKAKDLFELARRVDLLFYRSTTFLFVLQLMLDISIFILLIVLSIQLFVIIFC